MAKLSYTCQSGRILEGTLGAEACLYDFQDVGSHSERFVAAGTLGRIYAEPSRTIEGLVE
jgi:hypothetical protein